MKEIEKRWTQGPTAFFAPGTKCYEITYRHRKDPFDEWTYNTIRSTKKTKDDALKATIGFLRESRRLGEVDLVTCRIVSLEATIQTGGKATEVVSAREFRDTAEKEYALMEENKEDIEADIRAGRKKLS